MATYKQSDYEALRRRCVELSEAGWQQLSIDQAFGLTQPWVSRTLKKYRERGATALQEGKRTGALNQIPEIYSRTCTWELEIPVDGLKQAYDA